MAKVQTFQDKVKEKRKSEFLTVKLIRTVKTNKGSYKFNEKFVQVDDVSKAADVK